MSTDINFDPRALCVSFCIDGNCDNDTCQLNHTCSLQTLRNDESKQYGRFVCEGFLGRNCKDIYGNLTIFQKSVLHHYYGRSLQQNRNSKIQDFEEAIRQFEKSIHYNPNNANALNSYALLLKNVFNNSNQAAQHLRKCIKLQPNNGTFEHNYGILLSQQRSIEVQKQSLQHFERACKLQPKKHKYWLDYGNTLILLGNYKDALKCFATARSIGITQDINEEALNLIESSRLDAYDKLKRLEMIRQKMNHYNIETHEMENSNLAIKIVTKTLGNDKYDLFRLYSIWYKCGITALLSLIDLFDIDTDYKGLMQFIRDNEEISHEKKQKLYQLIKLVNELKTRASTNNSLETQTNAVTTQFGSETSQNSLESMHNIKPQNELVSSKTQLLETEEKMTSSFTTMHVKRKYSQNSNNMDDFDSFSNASMSSKKSNISQMKSALSNTVTTVKIANKTKKNSSVSTMNGNNCNSNKLTINTKATTINFNGVQLPFVSDSASEDATLPVTAHLQGNQCVSSRQSSICGSSAQYDSDEENNNYNATYNVQYEINSSSLSTGDTRLVRGLSSSTSTLGSAIQPNHSSSKPFGDDKF